MPLNRSRFTPFALVLLLLFAPVSARAQDKRLTLSEVFGPGSRVDFSGSTPFLRWAAPAAIGGTPRYLENRMDGRTGTTQLMAVDARTGEASPYQDRARIEAALQAVPGVDREAASQLARQAISGRSAGAAAAAVLLEYAGDLLVYDFASGRAGRATNTPDEPEDNASVSPNGKHVAFVRNNNLYVADVGGGAAARALTSDGGEKVLNGRLDWVYEEEVYGRGETTAYRWSPDSRRIAFLRLDETPVKSFVVVDHLPRLQETERQDYPKAGDPNPVARLGVAVVDGSSPVRFVDSAKYPDDDRLIVRFGWTPDSATVLYQVQNRIQSWLDLNAADPATGSAATLFRETSPAWVDVAGEPFFLRDGTFLWQSDRTGHRHLYRYRTEGTLIGAVTSGDWDVRTLHGVDEKTGLVYFSATEHSPIAPHAYRVRLDGEGGLKRLTTREGSHRVSFDPTFTFFLDTWSDIHTPPQLRVHAVEDGKVVRVLSDNARPRETLAKYRLGSVELVQVRARDGFLLDARLIKPVDFDPAKKYPVFCHVYGGPGGSSVSNNWSGQSAWYQFLAQNGYAVWVMDNRLASGKGAKSAWTSYKNLGEGELRDIEDGLDWLKAQGWVDPARIGIEGWSYGGYVVQYALTHSKSFKVGIAGAGVSDWSLYDTIYTERYMDTPQANPEGYRKSSATRAAANLSGKLLLLHGTMDDNVHLQNTIQFAYALQRAGKEFQMMLYPRSRHGVGDPAQSRHLHYLTAKFILENL